MHRPGLRAAKLPEVEQVGVRRRSVDAQSALALVQCRGCAPMRLPHGGAYPYHVTIIYRTTKHTHVMIKSTVCCMLSWHAAVSGNPTDLYLDAVGKTSNLFPSTGQMLPTPEPFCVKAVCTSCTWYVALLQNFLASHTHCHANAEVGLAARRRKTIG